MNERDSFRLPCGHQGTITLITELEILVQGPSKQPYCEKCHPLSQPDACTFFIFPSQIKSTDTIRS